MRTIIKKIAFSLVPFLAVFLFTECSVRLFAWSMLHSRRSGGAQTAAGKVVACYGDSWTYGLGVKADSAWPAALERALGAAGSAGVRVLNRGVPGAGIERVAEVVREDLRSEKRPSVMVVLAGVNDIPQFRQLSRKNLRKKPLVENFASYRLFRSLVVAARRRYAPAWDKAGTGLAAPAFQDVLQSLLSEIKKSGVEPVVLAYPAPVDPIRPQIVVTGDLDELAVAQRRASEQTGARFVDPQPLFDEAPGDEPWLDILYTHPGRLGYAMMAKALLPAVSELTGTGAAAEIDPRSLLVADDPSSHQWPHGSEFSRRKAVYTERRDEKGDRIIEADLNGDGAIDYRALHRDGHLKYLYRYDWATGSLQTNGYENRRRVHRSQDVYLDKNGDGVIDHFERMADGVLVRRQDDNDQDGRWEMWALIDERGNDYMHVADRDGDGRIDYWEVRDGDRIAWQASDDDHDGRPDRKLPPLQSLGLKNPNRNIIRIIR